MSNDACDDTGLQQAVRAEIEAVHDFLTAWFRGDIADDRETFDDQLTARLAPGLVNIQPAGKVLPRDELLDGIRKAHGANPAFAIQIHNVRIRGAFDPNGLVLATYVELQSGAMNTTPPDNARISTVLLQRDPGENRFSWSHIHETATAVPTATE